MDVPKNTTAAVGTHCLSPIHTASSSSMFDPSTLGYHLDLLQSTRRVQDLEEASLAPIVSGSVLEHHEILAKKGDVSRISQFGLLAGSSHVIDSMTSRHKAICQDKDEDLRLFFNVTSPSSTFICGSQGSGKSHTLSCMLENCLIPSRAGRLPNPLTGVIFHYDAFISDAMGSPCEAAFLSSHPDVKVRVLCSPTNIQSIRGVYSRFHIGVEPLQIDQRNLNTKRMMDLMAVGQDDGQIPLYMHTVQRILREMRILQQQTGSGFDYQSFKEKVMNSGLSIGQVEFLKQRLDTLESFMPPTNIQGLEKKKKKSMMAGGTSWQPMPGRLTIVDLSCPCISPETACSLFNVCLGIFLEQNTDIGRVVGLDEAHKYMNKSAEARVFTETLLSAIRLQRHLGARIIISTQEPTISTALLNLCSVTIVHRFTSPEWLHALRTHLAAAARILTCPIPKFWRSLRSREGSLLRKTWILFSAELCVLGLERLYYLLQALSLERESKRPVKLDFIGLVLNT